MFTINSQLLTDCHHLGVQSNNHVLLHKNASLHWFIIVPETQHLQLFELTEHELANVMQTSQLLHHYLSHTLHYPKTNFASIGNIVSQLHIHMVGRHEKDACWPQPVWGNLPDGAEYKKHELNKITQQLGLKTT